MTPILEIKNLSIHFDADHRLVRAVDKISFAINPGETVGIVGESGSGKSLTALSIMRLVPPPGKIKSGEIIFRHNKNSVDLLSLPAEQIRNYRGKEISMIFQEPMTSLNPVLTCGSQIAEAIRLHLKLSRNDARDHTLRLFEDVRMPDPVRIYRSYPHQLSGGQKQRVMIAMAMSCNPSVLIADEPTTALDVTVQARILELMKELQIKYNMAMIFITHDLAVVAEIADRILVMYNGSIVEQGMPSQIFLKPEHPYTRGLLLCRPPLDQRMRRLPVISDFMKEENGVLVENKAYPQHIMMSNMISAAETKSHYEKLQRRSAMLTVDHLCVNFVNRKSFFGNPIEIIKAVDDVSLDVREGETLGLVGESGCGKTTLGRAILRLIEPVKGEINFLGKDLMALSNESFRKVRRDIQIIFQDPYSSLNPRLTVGYAIMEPMKIHMLHANDKVRSEKAMELLEKVGMPVNSFNRFPHEFSGGERQRICIARVLSLDPKFIVCDECVSALDVSVQAQVLNLLMKLRDEFQLTYIFISHDLSVVKFMSDRMVVMNNGKIEELGPADEIYNHPASDFTKRLIAAIPMGIPKTLHIQ
ncbi:MAG: ABC transporter ATP-binding protein [Chitinophagales bacterium]